MNARILLAVPLLLAACSSGPDSSRGSCPRVAAVHDLVQYADFARAENPSMKEFVAAGRIESVTGTCRFRADGIDGELDIAMRATRGPRLGGDTISFPYFVAVVDQNDRVTAKQNLSAAFKLGEPGKTVERAEQLTVRLPGVKPEDGGSWRILVGFQLSPEQLAFNRGEADGSPVPARGLKP